MTSARPWSPWSKGSLSREAEWDDTKPAPCNGTPSSDGIHSRGEPMARRKADKAGEGERPITADFSAKLLEAYAGMILELAQRRRGDRSADRPNLGVDTGS